MAGFDGKFESAKQEWETPQKLFDLLNGEFNFTLDLAADKYNAKCNRFFDENDDALTQDWTGVCWLNPPYGGKSANALKNWVKKAERESAKHGSTIVVLCPARTNTKWWHESCMKAKEIKFICGRPKFGGAKHGLPQPLAVIVFSPHNQSRPILSSLYLK